VQDLWSIFWYSNIATHDPGDVGDWIDVYSRAIREGEGGEAAVARLRLMEKILEIGKKEHRHI
jgi:hypothetical protein